MVAQITWNTRPLDGALLSAFKPSVFQAKDYAKMHSPSSKAGAVAKRIVTTDLSSARADLVPTGLGFVFEGGRQGGYPISPGGVKGFRKSKRGAVTFNTTGRAYSYRSKRGGGAKALKFTRGDGGFAAYAVGGPMKAEPYIRPGAELWASQLYKNACRAILARRGFGVGNVR